MHMLSPSLYSKTTPNTIPTRVSEMLFSKLCHDLASPASATQNGIELLSDEDGGMAQDALELIQQSSSVVTHRLKYYRLCYGTASGSSSLNAEQTKHTIQNFFKSEHRLMLKFGDMVEGLSAESKKLLFNLVLCASDSLTHGGTIVVSSAPERLTVAAFSENPAKPPKEEALVLYDEATTLPADLSPYNVQSFYTGYLAFTLQAVLLKERTDASILSFTAALPPQ